MNPAVYPIELAGHLKLPNHRRLWVRPLRRCEGGVVRELYDHLSPRTRYLRFFSAMPALPDSVVRLLTCGDYRRRLSLVAEWETADGAEVGLVVRDEWQRQGIGVALAERVLVAAEARGFDRFVAHTLWDNGVLRKLLKHVGDIISSTTRHGVSELTFSPRRRS